MTQVYQSSTFKHRFWKFVTEKSFDDIPQDMKFVTHYPTFERFVEAMSLEIKDDGLREIHDHLKVVMGRIKPKNALSYTGSSKYFTKIESLVILLPQEYEITVNERFEGDEFKFAAAVTICKPVKGENLKSWVLVWLELAGSQSKIELSYSSVKILRVQMLLIWYFC